MKWGISMLTLAACVVGFAPAGEGDADVAKKIVGVWEVTKSEVPVPGATVEFTKDGKVTIRLKVKDKEFVINGAYKLKGKTITTTLEFEGKSKTETGKITKLTDKELAVEDEKGKVEEYRRK